MAASALHTDAPIERIRNLGIMAHIDAGKTTTSERILFYSGVSKRMGEVQDGASTLDWMEQEQERGITITAASTSFDWADCRCNLIDTPGHVDFTIEVERSLRVLDGAIAVFCAVGGVESQSETVWRQADSYRVPRIAFINKCDRVGASPDFVVEQMRERLSANPILVQYPQGLEDEFDAIIDLIAMRSRVAKEGTLGAVVDDVEIPESFRGEAERARERMLEAIAEVDDDFLGMFVAANDNKDIDSADIRRALRRATLTMKAVPVLIGAALKNRGVQLLLDAAIEYLPSPVDIAAAQGLSLEGESVAVEASADEPAAALAFKIMVDTRVGKVTYLRVYSGVLRSGDGLLNATKQKRERIGRLVRMHANERTELKELRAGDIGAAVGLRTATTGDTLCDGGRPVVLESMNFPEPVIGVAVEAETEDDREKLAAALDNLVVEDPSMRVHTDADSGQTIISGMGELHLDVLSSRLAREFGLQIRVGVPEVAFREAPSQLGSAEVRHSKQIGLRGQFAQLKVEVRPVTRGAGTEIRWRLETGSVSKDHSQAAEAGMTKAMAQGPLAGYPVTDTQITVVGAVEHALDSTPTAFEIAGLQVVRGALREAAVTLLEPTMAIEVVTPEAYVGDVIGDLNARRGKITGIESRTGVQVCAGLVPLVSMFGYATDLRSRTQGRATHTMQFSHYQEVPSQIREDVARKARGA